MPAEPPAGPVIVNSTPLIALWSVRRLELLRDLFGEVLIPQAVHDEFLAVEPAARAQALTHATWIKPAFLAFPNRALEFNGLDRGEAEVLALADERQASVVVIDERRARRYATRLGIPVTGTIGLLILAATVSTMLKPFLQQYLHDRSAPLVASQLSADEQRMLGQAVMLEEDDWMEWKAARAMLESWLGLDKEVNA